METYIPGLYYFMIAGLTIYPVIQLFKRGQKLAVRIVLIIILGLFWTVAIWNRSIVNTQNTIATAKNDSLSKRADSLSRELSEANARIEKKADSTNRFLQILDKKFGIKDSSGTPVKQTIVNYIKKVDYLKQF
ncbi:MAG: hypothetical protein P4L51_06040 [Puia sp.]|nr:hypothetical protein [Puia sp.]